MNFELRNSSGAEAYAQRPGSPSLDSGVLSGSIVPSSADIVDDASGDEWVLFSPQLGPIEELEAVDTADLQYSSHTSIQRDADLELPGHNGDGSFVEPQPASQTGRSGDWMERINSWRLEQSHLLFSEFQQHGQSPASGNEQGDGSIRFWRNLTRRAAQSIGHYLVWDDHVLDALFSPDFVPKDTDTSPPRTPRVSHLARAREHGPPGWEQRARRNAMPANRGEEPNGTFMGILARFLLWNYHSPQSSEQMSAHRHLEVLQDSTVPSMSSVPSAYWSDGWEYGTSTSVGTVA